MGLVSGASSVHRRTTSKVTTFVLLLFVSDVQSFAWHSSLHSILSGKHKVEPATRTETENWYPSTFWWRDRKNVPSVGSNTGLSAVFGLYHAKPSGKSHLKKLRVKPLLEDNMLEPEEQDNRITNMPVASPFSGGFGTPGWDFLRPDDSRAAHSSSRPPNYVSLHYSTPVFRSPTMDRRGHITGRHSEIHSGQDEEMVNNVIREVLQELQSGPLVRPSYDSANDVLADQRTPIPAPEQPNRAKPTLSSSADDNPKPQDKTSVNVGPHAKSHASPIGAVIDLSSSFETVPSEDEGFGQFVDYGSPDITGFGPPLVFGPPVPVDSAHNVQPVDYFGFDSAPGFQTDISDSFQSVDPFMAGSPGEISHTDAFQSAGTFKPSSLHGLSKQDGFANPPGFSSGHLEPAVFSGSSSAADEGFGWGLQPAGSASEGSSPAGSFVQDDKDCDTILTKSCSNDSECMCYGFYHCEAGRCRELSASDNRARTYGDKWQDGPAEKLGLTKRG